MCGELWKGEEASFRCDTNNSQGEEAFVLHEPPSGGQRPEACQLGPRLDGVQRIAARRLDDTGYAAWERQMWEGSTFQYSDGK